MGQVPTTEELQRATREALQKTAEAAVELIRKRTASGVDPDGVSFPPYSPAYAKRKGSSTPTLTVTGGFLRELQVLSTDEREAVFGWRGKSAAIAAGNQKKRPILAIRSADERAQLVQLFRDELKRQLGR